jgi:hypothetical protein
MVPFRRLCKPVQQTTKNEMFLNLKTARIAEDNNPTLAARSLQRGH